MLDWRKFIGKDNEIDVSGITGKFESDISTMDEMVENILEARKEISLFCKYAKKDQKIRKRLSKWGESPNITKYTWSGTPPWKILDLLIARLEKNIQKIRR